MSGTLAQFCRQFVWQVLCVSYMSSALIDVRSRGRFGSSRGDRGATSVEYALMASLIALVIIGSVTAFGLKVVPLFHVPASAL